MKFCPHCQSVMTKSTSTGGEIIFLCRCQYSIVGDADDTLMEEAYLETAESNKFDVAVENAALDPAAYRVLNDCPKCGLNFMSLSRVGLKETTIYSCDCKYRATYDEYIKEISLAETDTPARTNAGKK